MKADLGQPNNMFWDNVINLIVMISSLTNVALFTSCFIFVLIKVKGKIFLGLGVVLFIFETFFIIRGLTDTFLYYIKKDETIEDETFSTIANVVSTIFSRVKWFTLYYFVI
jgi:hypothetical protein